MSQEAPVQALLACSLCGRAFDHSELVQISGNWLCADCKPAFLNRVMASGTASPLARRYGGFWVRFRARMIDGFVLAVPALIGVLILMPGLIRAGMQTRTSAVAPNSAFTAFGVFSFFLFFLFCLLVAICYEILMLKYYSATLGKMACGLKVVRSDGRGLSWGVCFGRFLMWNIVTCGTPYLNSVLMPVSSIMLGVDNEKRALHDRVCDTRVIYKQSLA